MGIRRYPLHRGAPSLVGLAVHIADQYDVLFKENSAWESMERQSLKTVLTS